MSPSRNRNRETKKATTPSGPPNPGSVYKAHSSILIGGDAKKDVMRRVGAIKAIPGPPPAWITLGRTTTDHRRGDLPSPADDRCGLNLDGWWSKRFQHTIQAEQLGNEVQCPYLGELSEEARIQVLAYYDE